MQSERVANDSQACKDLRRKIQAQRTTRLGWNEYVFRFVMEGLGYGRSLRALDEERLAELLTILTQYRRDPAFTYDSQGKYMYRLQKDAGWSDTVLRQFMVIHYKKTHWNILDEAERAELIGILEDITKGEIHER
ncbi:MAG: hypothetical protein M0Q16_08730 [Candidatus Cloacimonetes bacterium]|jgi:hypothetical protein|nr:hypothetical protein [Candidatus Cloacimonadota bacterium]MCK9185443.1 hypothetical protein [Candidatus Cloacimonadota bacterium]